MRLPARRRLAVAAVTLVCAGLLYGTVVGTAHAGDSSLATGTADQPDCGATETYVHSIIKYEYTPALETGYYRGNHHTVPGIEVDIVEAVDGSNVTLAETTTGTDGRFDACITPVGDDDTHRVFARFTLRGPAGSVWNNASIVGGEIYTVPSGVTEFNSSDDSVQLGRDIAGDDQKEVVPVSNVSAFHVANGLYHAWNYSKTHLGFDRKRIRVVTPLGFRSEYVQNPPIDENEEIWLADEVSSRTMRVIHHEYGHALFSSIYDLNVEKQPDGEKTVGSDGLCHVLATESGTGFGMNEGWAEYFAKISAGALWEASSVYYNRTDAFCGHADDDGTMDGWRVEGSIAAIFLDITDDTPEEDPLNKSFRFVYDTLNESNPQSMFEVYDAFSQRLDGDNQSALDQIFITHGIDVVEPNVTIAGGQAQTVGGETTTLSGTVSDAHSNLTRVQVQTPDGSWRTVAGDDATDWRADVAVDGRESITVRATDHWGNNATLNVSVETTPSLVGSPVGDPDDDGIYEDLDADGQGTLFDALTYYENRNSETIQANPDVFDYDGDGRVGTLFDAIALYNGIGT